MGIYAPTGSIPKSLLYTRICSYCSTNYSTIKRLNHFLCLNFHDRGEFQYFAPDTLKAECFIIVKYHLRRYAPSWHEINNSRRCYTPDHQALSLVQSRYTSHYNPPSQAQQLFTHTANNHCKIISLYVVILPSSTEGD